MNKQLLVVGIAALAISLGAVVAPASAEKGGQVKSEDKGSSVGFASTFNVEKANLTNVGKNPYFNLEPGHRLHFKGDGATLTVTVTEKTKLVDGVETFVLVEISKGIGKK